VTSPRANSRGWPTTRRWGSTCRRQSSTQQQQQRAAQAGSCCASYMIQSSATHRPTVVVLCVVHAAWFPASCLGCRPHLALQCFSGPLLVLMGCVQQHTLQQLLASAHYCPTLLRFCSFITVQCCAMLVAVCRKTSCSICQQPTGNAAIHPATFTISHCCGPSHPVHQAAAPREQGTVICPT
jgi:hypothetical protein